MGTIVLPWPDSRLSPNAKRRTHWRVYQPVAKLARSDAHALTCCAIPLGEKKTLRESGSSVPITVTFVPPDRRRRDDDGMIGAFKHARDGIADALGIDDRLFKPTYVIAEPEKPGRVEVEI